MIGALSGGPAANFIGRKWSLVLTNIFTLVGAFLEAYPMGVFYGEGYKDEKVNLSSKIKLFSVFL